jgi:hypothetical protein
MTGKNHAIPGLHRDHLLAKERGPNPDAKPGTTTYSYCRAVVSKLGDPIRVIRLRLPGQDSGDKANALLLLTK